MEEIHDLLEYGHLKIVQRDDLFKFSLDSVLLARFVTIQYRTKKILDIGTGNAPIPLILSTRTSAHITGVEIQKESMELAQKSIALNHLEKQIQIIQEDIHAFYKDCESDIYDVITCNPPYFKYQEDSFINDKKEKSIARHEMHLKVEDICKIAKKLLKNNGRVAIVHRAERLIDIIIAMRAHNIEPKRICFVYPYKGKEANLVLVEGTKNGNSGVHVVDSIYIYNENKEYTEEVQSFFK